MRISPSQNDHGKHKCFPRNFCRSHYFTSLEASLLSMQSDGKPFSIPHLPTHPPMHPPTNPLIHKRTKNEHELVDHVWNSLGSRAVPFVIILVSVLGPCWTHFVIDLGVVCFSFCNFGYVVGIRVFVSCIRHARRGGVPGNPRTHRRSPRAMSIGIMWVCAVGSGHLFAEWLIERVLAMFAAVQIVRQFAFCSGKSSDELYGSIAGQSGRIGQSDWDNFLEKLPAVNDSNREEVVDGSAKRS